MDLKSLILDSNIINFTIAIVLIAWFVMSKFPAAVAGRKSEIQKELLAAKEAKLAAEEKLKELEAQIKNAKVEALQIVENAKVNADSLQKQTLKEAKIEIKRLQSNAQKEIAMHKENAINSIKEQMLSLTMNSVEKSLFAKKEEVDKLIKNKLQRDLKAEAVK